uniref:glutamate synthase (ferredoxin) n=1 Tax=Paulinella micropora TaxID=1928728 RepID=A0A385I0T1_9EUKA|nr:glutamate synthase [Paulinella micropora]AXY63484.1 glutamate synthase [Paulinella micropora]
MLPSLSPVWPYCDSLAPTIAGINEKDACGVGFIAQIQGKRNYWVIQQALLGLSCMEHRGGCGGDGDSGDGAGILCEIPWTFLQSIWPPEEKFDTNFKFLGLGMVFLPTDSTKRKKIRKLCNDEAKALGLTPISWHVLSVNDTVLGTLAQKTAPVIQQWLLGCNETSRDIFETKLLRLRRRVAENIRSVWGLRPGELYFASLSSRTVVYKAMVRSDLLPIFYPDLQDHRFQVSFAIYHRRFSTNTLPRWPLAQPMRLIAHNGEINSLLGNLNWARASEIHIDAVWQDTSKELKPVVNAAFSDSANLDAILELLVCSGRALTDSLLMLVPEAFQHQPELINRPSISAFYEYNACIQEPWDGPALLVFADGKYVGATLDRNGLRPARYCITKGGYIVMGSEVGVSEVRPERVVEKGRLGPGQMIAIDLENKKLLKNWDVKEEAASRFPYREWLDQSRIDIKQQPWNREEQIAEKQLITLQTSVGFSAEDFELVIQDMASQGKEPTYCMGDDTPLAVLSTRPHLVYDYFKQLFAQVTNPAIDPLREKLVMSLSMYLGSRGSIFRPSPEGASILHIDSPILNEGELLSVMNQGFPYMVISTLVFISNKEIDFDQPLTNIVKIAEIAVLSGCKLLILSDRVANGINAYTAYIPPLLVVSTLHHHLLRLGVRLRCSLVIDTAQCWNTHHIACLVGYGASAVCPWLAWETTRHWVSNPKTQKLIERGKLPSLTAALAQENVSNALEDGLRKILSKIGISLLSSYHGAQVFESVGLGADLIERTFTGTTSRVAGLKLSDLATETLAFHRKAYGGMNRGKLEFMGFVQYRTGGEYHLNNPAMAKTLRSATTAESRYESFSTYRSLVEDRPTTALRDLLDLNYDAIPLPIDEVESIESICERFCTGGMSLGALSRESHEVLAIAMNRVGGKSNSGEGGEDSARFNILDNVNSAGSSTTLPTIKGLQNGDTACSAIKQIASGRFGVTPAYIRSSKQLEIKVAQGAKPGEGGQLPGSKVDEYIGWLRRSKPGVALISPPPHHDVYSIEDLAQLIFDLHQIHPTGKVSVKLVSEVGIGTIASGVVKANADIIQVSGCDGGTGASPLSSIKHAGTPWELGLTEVHRSLLSNGLRDRVVIRIDGGLKTGLDVVLAALLGAEEFGFGSVAMIAEGCIMARVCHTNNCPVGVATQKEELRERFEGIPDHVVNFFLFVAEEVRQMLSLLGVSSLDEIIGRGEFLRRRELGIGKASRLDLTTLLTPTPYFSERAWLSHSVNAHQNGPNLEYKLLNNDELMMSIKRHEDITYHCRIKNTDRSVAARLSGEIASYHGDKGFKGRLNLLFKGSAGQSFGAFTTHGMRMKLIGEANDYVGKGISGGKILVTPPSLLTNPSNQAIMGNTCLYGATGGELFALGRAGERFGIRNSGAYSVVEGVGDHCCEYMTGGMVVILGSTGVNVSAGMTGGIVFILDEACSLEQRINPDNVTLFCLTNLKQEILLTQLIKAHLTATKSSKAANILRNWDQMKNKFKIVVPPSEEITVGIVREKQMIAL